MKRPLAPAHVPPKKRLMTIHRGGSPESVAEDAVYSIEPDTRCTASRELGRRLVTAQLQSTATAVNEARFCLMIEALLVVMMTDPVGRCRTTASKALAELHRLNRLVGRDTEELKDVAISAITPREVGERLAPYVEHLVTRHRCGLLACGALVPASHLLGPDWRGQLPEQLRLHLNILDLRRESVEVGRATKMLEWRAFQRDASWARAIGRAYARGVQDGADERHLRALLDSDMAATRDRLAPLAAVLS